MTRTISFLQAINEAMAEEMRRDPKVIVLGEDVHLGAFGQTTGLIKEFGSDRVVNTPIAENAITGVAMGTGLNGLRPVLELMFCDFALLAMDQICNHLGQWRYFTGNQYSIPITIRTTVGAGFRMAYGHSQSLESQFIQAPGLILVAPSNPYDAKGLLKSAIRSDDPVLFFEHKKLILGGVQGEVPEEEYTIPFGKAVVRVKGKDCNRRGHDVHGLRGHGCRCGAGKRRDSHRGDRSENACSLSTRTRSLNPWRRQDDSSLWRREGSEEGLALKSPPWRVGTIFRCSRPPCNGWLLP